MEIDTAPQPIRSAIPDQLAISAARSFGWNLAGAFVRSGSGFLIGVVLARLLGPEPFGLVALAMVVISIGNLIIDSGLGAGLIQKKEVIQNDIRYVFTIQILLGVGFAVTLIIVAPVISEVFHQSAVVPVVRTLSLLLVFQAASQTSTSLLKRELAFKKIQKAQVVSYLLGYICLGIPLALARLGVWSLVFAQLAQSLIYLTIVYSWTRHSLIPSLHNSGSLIGFGLNVLGANISSWVVLNLDNTLVGRSYGMVNLGLYSRALTLTFTPVSMFISAAQSVLFSAASKMQEEPEKIRGVFIDVFNFITFLFVPIAFAEAATARAIVELIYGPGWIQATAFLVPLSLAMPFYALMAIQGPLLAGLGKPHLEMKMQVISSVLGVILMGLGALYSLGCLIWAVFVVYVFRFLFLSLVTFRTLGVPFKDVLRKAIISIILGIVIFYAIKGIGIILHEKSAILQFTIQFTTGLSIWILASYIFGSLFFTNNFQSIINKINNKAGRS